MSIRFTIYKFVTILLAFLYTSTLSSQDTTWIQAFQYHSKTRDSLIQFPNGDHNQYEKILMYYNMRCKNGLVSTGTDRNKGCGEWDYSCNTNVIDSSGIDSLKAIHPDYVISGINEDFFAYTTKPTYTYTDYNIQKITVNSTSGISNFPVGMQLGSETIISNSQNNYKAWFLYKKEEMQGLTSGNIFGLKMKNKKTGTLKFLKIKLAATNETELSNELVENQSLIEVVNRNLSFNSTGETDIYFHKPFNYNGTANLLIEISFTGKKEDIQDLEILGTAITENLGIGNILNDKYLELGNQGTGNLTVEGMKNIKNEITIAFWANGNEKVLPANNSIFYAEDKNNNRQLNVHLPWSNARVYWDCGGDATGYDRIDKATSTSEYKGKWNHWAFTKNVNSGSMKIYLNGQLWHSSTGKTKPIFIDQFVIGSDITNNSPYYGLIDDFTVWDIELSQQDINKLLKQNPLDISPIQTHLMAYYDMNDDDATTQNDKSRFNGNCVFQNKINQKTFRGNDLNKSFESLNARPDISWLKGNVNVQTTNILQRDSIQNTPIKITPYSIIDKKLAMGTPFYYWAPGTFDIYDEIGNITGEVTFPDEDVLFINDLIYYTYAPAKYELLSFVTPYGIGLNLGDEGKTWIFDVTDYGPVLKNKKRFLMDKGGEWQEEMNIKFAFIKGKPSRPVISIQQVWPATSYGYQSILNHSHLESRQLNANLDVKSMKLRTVATGHGQEGEFISRNHSINVNGGSTEFSWQLWKECGDNPVYPQGGTWIYDRAGWCPGAPSDLREFELMPLVKAGNNFTLDYGLNTASGDSRYIINTQLVKYGEATFSNDAAIEEIISPSSSVQYQRINPACANPTIIIKNNGAKDLESVVISYGIEGFNTSTYTWNGKLPFLQKAQITLPNLPANAFYNGKKFFVNIIQVNNTNDEYANNNSLSADLTAVKNLQGGIIIAIKTNGMPNETKWTLKDSDGKTIKSSQLGMAGFSIYMDTITNLSGCYQLQFTDSDDDGISFWANGDGAGYIRAKGLNGTWMEFQPDFGSEFTFNFVSDVTINALDENENKIINIYPNPTTGETNIALSGFMGTSQIELCNQTGLVIRSEQFTHHSLETEYINTDLSENPAGIYFIKITNKTLTRTYKLIKL